MIRFIKIGQNISTTVSVACLVEVTNVTVGESCQHLIFIEHVVAARHKK